MVNPSNVASLTTLVAFDVWILISTRLGVQLSFCAVGRKLAICLQNVVFLLLIADMLLASSMGAPILAFDDNVACFAVRVLAFDFFAMELVWVGIDDRHLVRLK